jgi:hypothetical protein
LCTAAAPSCHDEKVAYYVEAVPDKPDSMFIRADRIVDGKAIAIGSGSRQHDRARHTLAWPTERQIWLLNIMGSRIEDTIALAGNIVVRRVSLRRSD